VRLKQGLHFDVRIAVITVRADARMQAEGLILSNS
jgi:hypothetical protein